MKGILFLIFSLCLAATYAQTNRNGGDTISVGGKITDERGKPISFVSVNLYKSSVGLNVNNTGEFLFSKLKQNDSLLFTCTGYYPTGYKIKSSKNITVILQQQVYQFKNDKGRIVLMKDQYVGQIPIMEKMFSAKDLSNPVSPPSGPFHFEKVSIGTYIKNQYLKLDSLLSETLPFPKKIKDKYLTLDFIVNREMKIENCGISEKSFSKLADKVCVILNNVTEWLPAIQNGRSVPVRCRMKFEVYKKDRGIKLRLTD